MHFFVLPDEPNVLLDALRHACGVRVGRTRVFQVAAAHVDDGGSIGQPGKFSNVLAVIDGIIGKLARGEVASIRLPFRHPDVARSRGIENPCGLGRRGRGRQLGWKRRAHYLLERKGLRPGREAD